MRLLVTGGCGFIGAVFCRRIKKQHPYLTLVNVDYLYPCSTISSDLTTSFGNYTFVHGDIKNKELLTTLLQEHNIDTVIHFAAQSHVDTSFTNPLLYTYDNTIGTHILLEACRLYGKIKKFVQISTDEVYGENTKNVNNNMSVFTETSLLKPTNPYAASKASAEMFVHSYIHSYNLPAIVIRSNNVYGPGQYDEKVLPKFIFQLLDNQKLTIQGSGHQLRSFLYVEDAVDAILCVMFQGKIGEIYNISSDDEISIRTLATKLLAELKPTETIDNNIIFIEDRNFNDKRYWIESEPLKQLGWKQQWSLDKGLKETINWFKKVDRINYWVGNSNIKKVLIWGSRGWIGKQFKQVLQNKGWQVVEALTRADDKQSVIQEVEKVRPSHIVSLIGRTHGGNYTTIDYLEQSGKLKENINDNLYGPIVLAGVAKEKNIHMTYIGTGCIFEYDENHTSNNNDPGFIEADKPNFFGSSYSIVKGFTDRLMQEQFADTCLNVRIRMPISSQDNPRNFISKIIAYNKICNVLNSMTVLDDILPIIADCMDKNIKKTLNAVNPGLIDHRTILEWYRELQNLDHTWEEIDTNTLLDTCVKGARSNNKLDTTLIESYCPTIHNIKDSVRYILEKFMFRPRL